MGIDNLQVGGEPFDRLTILCEEMTAAIARPENVDVKGIVFLNADDPDNPGKGIGGIQMFGYDSTSEGMADLLIHMKAIFKSMGKNFGVMTDQGLMLLDEM